MNMKCLILKDKSPQDVSLPFASIFDVTRRTSKRTSMQLNQTNLPFIFKMLSITHRSNDAVMQFTCCCQRTVWCVTSIKSMQFAIRIRSFIKWQHLADATLLCHPNPISSNAWLISGYNYDLYSNWWLKATTTICFLLFEPGIRPICSSIEYMSLWLATGLGPSI